jgi:predicted ATP-dependent endonuclease of OLD family
MHLDSLRIKNFRRLKDVRIDLADDTTIFVGANNSGKTSAAQIFQAFLNVEGEKSRFSLYDFSADCWSIFNEIGSGALPQETALPSISLDLWFKVKECDLHYVIKLLPSLDWKNTPVGVRLEFAPKDPKNLLSKYSEAKAKAKGYADTNQGNGPAFHPRPVKLTDYLEEHLRDEYKIFYYVLDRIEFDENFVANPGYIPSLLGDGKENGAAIMNTLLRVDFLTAQRHQVDATSSGKGSKLAKRLNDIYKHNRKKNDGGFKAVAALAQSEAQLNEHMVEIFEPTLTALKTLGYPGFANPHLLIKSDLNPDTILTENARVHYQLRDPGNGAATDEDLTLPDKYNGLGFKNLIYMVIEVLEAHRRWVEEEEDRPPLHLVIIEEPEAHLHVQLQQAFIKNIRKLLGSEDASFLSQLIITTHSPHIVYESGFEPIRYFRRSVSGGVWNSSEVLNLFNFRTSEDETRNFLLQYMKLTHCDLFFADAAVLVEGNVERLLLPLMIQRAAPDLQSSYLSIIEIGGAFAFRFRELIEFLGVTTLVITDLDSVLVGKSNAGQASNVMPDNVVAFSAAPADHKKNAPATRARACRAEEVDAETSNQTLIRWLPQRHTIEELLTATEDLKAPKPTDANGARVRVAYQTQQTVNWQNDHTRLTGRTFEEAFAFENLMWCLKEEQEDLGLGVEPKVNGMYIDINEVTQKVHTRVSKDLEKTHFALALIMKDPPKKGSPYWKTPAYIVEGLRWLRAQLFPNQVFNDIEPGFESEAAQ